MSNTCGLNLKKGYFSTKSNRSSSSYGVLSSMTRGSIMSGDVKRVSVTNESFEKTIGQSGKVCSIKLFLKLTYSHISNFLLIILRFYIWIQNA